uniref:Uncharacterized protein n=1 Tax=Strigamia maritima TaxID=126957 RepID=T1JER4_STRMM
TEAWERLSVNGILPGPRSRHSSIVVPSVLLIPSDCKQSERPKSIPCQSVLARTNSRQRPVSSPPTDKTEVEHDNFQLLEWQTEIGHLKATDSHNQINFRTIKDRISNVSLLKPSYSTYSALSNSSESVQDDEPDQIAEMQNCTNERLRARNGTGLSIRYRNQISGETLSRDLMSVPNFQQLSTIIVPTREVQTPQATNSYGLYDSIEDDWISTSTEKLSFDKFLQYYSLVPGNETTNGIEHAITDSEDSGIHGDNGDIKNRLNDEENVHLPGMVDNWEDTFAVPARSSVVRDEFSLIDLHNENSKAKNVNNSVRFSNCSDIHKDYVSCLNHSTNPETIKRRRPPVAGLELKTFPQVQEEIMKSNQSADKRPKAGKQNGCDVKRVQLCNTTYLSEKNDNEEQNDKDFPIKPDEQPHHFSMLIFGGREDGQQTSSINKALTIWRCEVWR